MRLLLAEDRDQHVRNRDFLLAARLHVEDGPLQNALEAERRLDFAVVLGSERGRRLVDEFLELDLQSREVGATGLQDLAHARRVEDRQEQVLHRHVLVARVAGLLVGLVQAEFELTRKHQVLHRAQRMLMLLSRS